MYKYKDLITPVVTISGVWIGARLALHNEIRKKTLELEAERLVPMAEECDIYLRNLNGYCMRVARLLHDFSDGYKKRVTLADITEGLKKSAEAGTAIDHNAARTFQNTLGLHRSADFAEWKELIVPLVLSQFIL